MFARLYTALAITAAFVACRMEQRAPSNAPVAPSYSSIADTTTWIEWRGEGFALQHPPGSRVVPDTDRFSGFVGSALRWDFRNNQWLRIAIDRFPPISAASLGRFVDSIRIARNAELNPEWQLAPPTATKIGQYSGFELGPDCGDCVAREVYVALPSAWVVASFSLEEGLPYTYEQQDSLYRRILHTLRP